jgi:OPA family glycerol-3-phosphate transporter-like MFS transporter
VIGFVVAKAAFHHIDTIGLDRMGWPHLTVAGEYANGAPAVGLLTLLFALNMYFQSFGAVAIVKVNASWFHLRERGTFGGIFGILISLGLYFAYDVIGRIKGAFDIQWIFLVPAMILFVFFVLSWLFVRNNPSDTGHPDFDLGDATKQDDPDAPKLGFGPWLQQIFVVLRKMLSHPVLLTIALIELCSGFLRQAILQWGPDFGKGVGMGNSFVFQNWGMVSCVAGITGGMFAGAISDHLFDSRRSPVSAVLYGIMLAGAIVILVILGASPAIGWTVAFMSMAIIAVSMPCTPRSVSSTASSISARPRSRSSTATRSLPRRSATPTTASSRTRRPRRSRTGASGPSP